ncbi:amidohydrolase [Devosia sp. 1566]|uniref:amidohydrolase n=1 Tax=Devosia sp. 1566 TaxID=2499144 RepID=UPI000FDAEBE0|nr:amidohydrolase [Devosia sp. 1566]
MTSSTLFQNVLVVGAAGTTRPFAGWVAVRDGRISGLGQDDPAELNGFGETIDGNGNVLMPGLVNAHCHSHSSLTRGSAEGVVLEDWLGVIEREQANLTDAEARVAALATYGEALMSGTTSMLDMCIRPRPAVDAALECGIRLVVAPYVADTKPFAPHLDDTVSLLEAFRDTDPRVRVWVGLHDLESCSDAQIRQGIEIAAQYEVGLHLHCSETRFSVDRTRARTGRSPVAHLHDLGGLGATTLLAHGVWLNDDDRRIIAGAGAHVAHCPHANLKLGSGIAEVPLMCSCGINVALATDGAKANNRLDMFDVMKFASLLHKGLARDPTLLGARQVLDMATRGGAAAIGAVGVGAIAPGMAADLVMINTHAFHLQPCLPDTAETNLVHAARGSDVSLTMVDGQVLVRDGVLVRAAHRAALAEHRLVAEELAQRARATAF